MPPAATAPRGRKTSRVAARRSPKRARRVSAPVPPRRISGPLAGRPARARVAPLHERIREFIRNLPDHALLDRIVRGRTWIALLGVMLAGIVAMQVELLKLGASIGRSIELGAALQSRNDHLRASVSALSDPQRIERLASGMGMVMAGPTSVQFLDARDVRPAKAAANIHAPDAASFQAALQAMLSSATQSSSMPGASTAAPTASAPATAATGASQIQSPAAAAAPTAAATTPATAGATPPTGGAATPVAPTGVATAPTSRAATPSGGAAAPTAAAPPGTSGSQGLRGNG